jgi:hypothetical protein
MKSSIERIVSGCAAPIKIQSHTSLIFLFNQCLQIYILSTLLVRRASENYPGLQLPFGSSAAEDRHIRRFDESSKPELQGNRSVDNHI